MRKLIALCLLITASLSVSLAYRASSEEFSAYGRVSTELLNVRNIPTAKGSEVIGQFEEGTIVSVVERYRSDNNTSEWYYVKASDGTEGWVSGKYIEISDSKYPSTAKDRQSRQNKSSDGGKNFIDYILLAVSSLWKYTWGKVIVVLLALSLIGKLTGGGKIDENKPVFQCQNCGKRTNDPASVFFKNCAWYINGKSVSAPHRWIRMN